MFSIVIPLYNKEKQILNTINSIQYQTFQDYEIVIVNDGSTDSSVEIVNQIDDKRIKLINQKNGGVSNARNTGIDNASHEYIAFLDADDEWEDDYLETIKNMIFTYTECSIFGTNYKIVDSKNKIKFPVDTKIVKFKKSMNSNTGIIEDYFDYASKTAPPLWTGAIVVKKIAIESINKFPLGVKMGEDLITWAKLATFFEVCYTKEVKSKYFFKSNDELLDDEPLPDKTDYVGIELQKLLVNNNNLKTVKNYISLWYKMRTTMYLANFRRIDALKSAIKMIYFNPQKLKNYLVLVLCILPHRLRIIISKQVLKRKK